MNLEYKFGYFPTDSGCVSRSKIVAKAVTGSSTAISTELSTASEPEGHRRDHVCMNPLGIKVVDI